MERLDRLSGGASGEGVHGVRVGFPALLKGDDLLLHPSFRRNRPPLFHFFFISQAGDFPRAEKCLGFFLGFRMFLFFL